MDSNGVDSGPGDSFVPGFSDVSEYVKSGFGLMVGATRWANAMPAAADLSLPAASWPPSQYRTIALQMTKNVQHTFSALLALERLTRQQLGKVPGVNSLPELNDLLVDSISEDLNVLEGGPSSVQQPLAVSSPASSAAFFNRAPVVSTIEIGGVKMLAARNVERPQVSFKDKVDNSPSTLWQPRLVDKPNNLKPLALQHIYDEEGEPIGFRHPYETELDAYEPPEEFLKEGGLLEMKTLEETPFTHVENLAQLRSLAKHLMNVKEMAVDVEHHSYRTYQGITCLIQISTVDGGDFIVDTLSLREHLHILNESFTNPRILKVLHGADLDVIWLQRDLGLYLVGLLDTHQAAILLEHQALSLLALIQRYCNITLDKKHQLADWRMRPLPDELCEYARLDTHYLLYVWRRMKQELLQGERNLLQAAFSRSRVLCTKTYTKPVLLPDSYMDLLFRSRKNFNSKQLAALKAIYAWRDGIARLEDESTGYVLPNHMLLSIAETLPREMQGVLACCNPVPPLLKRNLLQVYQMVLAARDMKNEVVTSVEAAPAAMPAVPAALSCIHDRVPDFREGLPVYLKDRSLMKQRRKASLDRKPYSLDASPPRTKVDIKSIIRTFASPFDRCRLVKNYQELKGDANDMTKEE